MLAPPDETSCPGKAALPAAGRPAQAICCIAKMIVVTLNHRPVHFALQARLPERIARAGPA